MKHNSIPTGFNCLDKLTGGWQKGSLTAVASKPTYFKTTFAMSIARNLAVDQNVSVAIFFLDADSAEFASRKVSEFGDAPIFLDVSPSLTLNEFSTKCNQLNSTNSIDVITVDSLQLLAMNSKQGADEVLNSLKQIAEELDIVIIATCELNKEAGKLEERPKLSDLEETKTISKYADAIILLYPLAELN